MVRCCFSLLKTGNKRIYFCGGGVVEQKNKYTRYKLSYDLGNSRYETRNNLAALRQTTLSQNFTFAQMATGTVKYVAFAIW